MYIVDSDNQCIRKVDNTGVITTVAGTGIAGYNGDGGFATAAQLNEPPEVAIDAAGNILIADDYNNRIRKVNTIGIITTIVGNGIASFSGDSGQATAAEVNGPGVTIDAAGNIIMVDYVNQRIRMINTAGIISTIAGTGVKGFSGDGGLATNAKLNGPNGVAIDASMCNLYIADAGNDRIRKVDFSPVIKVSSATICSGTSTTLIASNATTYTWSTGENTDSLVVSPTTTSSYTIAGTGINGGCVSKAVITVSVTPTPSVSISGEETICIGDNTTLIASGANTYTWSTGDTTASIILKPTLTTTYTAVGTIATCSNVATTTVNVNTAFDFVLPNIVTPNNDGINDFIDFGKFQFSLLQLEIYNRWGKQVFESTNPTCVWKPTEDDGTYFYSIKYIINCNTEKQTKNLKGFITVLR